MNCFAASVMTTWTSRACRCRARTSSAALYAAMPPETPTVTFIARLYARGTRGQQVAVCAKVGRRGGILHAIVKEFQSPRTGNSTLKAQASCFDRKLDRASQRLEQKYSWCNVRSLSQ